MAYHYCSRYSSLIALRRMGGSLTTGDVVMRRFQSGFSGRNVLVKMMCRARNIFKSSVAFTPNLFGSVNKPWYVFFRLGWCQKKSTEPWCRPNNLTRTTSEGGPLSLVPVSCGIKAREPTKGILILKVHVFRSLIANKPIC